MCRLESLFDWTQFTAAWEYQSTSPYKIKIDYNKIQESKTRPFEISICAIVLF